MLDYDDDMSEGGCQSQTVTLACGIALVSRHHADARSHLVFPMCNLYLERYMGFHVRSRM